MKKKIALFLAAVISLGLLAGCGGGGGTASKDITIAIGEEGYGLDPVVAGDSVSNNQMQNMFEGWYYQDDKGALIEALAAGAPKTNDAKTEYTFTIRDGAKWSDGEPVKAEDFVTGIRHALNPKIKNDYVSKLYYLKGGEAAYKNYTEENLKKVGVEAIDEKTVKYTLNETTLYFPQLLVQGTYYPLRADKINKDDGKWAMDPEKAVGTGAFKLKEYKAKEHVIMVKNEHYYNADKVKLETVTMKYIPDQQAQQVAFESGEIQVADQPPTNITDSYSNSKEIFAKSLVVNYYITMSQLDKTMQNAKVREALALAVDRQAICQVLGISLNTPLYGIVPPGLLNSASNKDFREEGGNLAPERDVEKAKQLLKEAGYSESNPLKLTYETNANQRHEDVATLLQKQFEEIGVKITVVKSELNVFFTKRATGDFQMARHAMSADYGDPTTYLSMYPSWAKGQNEAQIKDAKYDELMKKAASETDATKRMDILHEAEKVLIQEGHYLIPLFSYKEPMLVKENIKGLYTDPSGTIRLQGTSVA